MSRHAQLPPRCPIQKKNVTPVAKLPVSQPSGKDTELQPGQYSHFSSLSQSSILEEQPPWLNDLLCDSDSSSNGASLGRTASDSSTLLEDLAEDSCEEDGGMGSIYMYGPNSPRRKNKIGFPETEIVSAFSEYVMQNPMLYLDTQASADQISSDNKQMKRHPGQRSRARKLQYITELEKTADVLENLGSDLGMKVASLIQQYSALMMENNTLKQHLLRLKHKKIVVDGEYESLTKEVERLRGVFNVSTNKNHLRSRSAANFSRSDANFSRSDAIWNVLDMRRLDLN